MPGGTTVPYKKTKHKTFNAFCIQLAFLVNTEYTQELAEGQHSVRHGAANWLHSAEEVREKANAYSEGNQCPDLLSRQQ